jgi:hypothetical protein
LVLLAALDGGDARELLRAQLVDVLAVADALDLVEARGQDLLALDLGLRQEAAQEYLNQCMCSKTKKDSLRAVLLVDILPLERVQLLVAVALLALRFVV